MQMQRLRLLAISLLASACLVQATAQTPFSPHLGNSSTIPLTMNSQDVSRFSASHQPPSASSPIQSPPENQYNFSNFNTASLKSDPLVLRSSERTLDRQLQPKELANSASAEQTNSSCYTMRVYGFTAQDLKLPHPQPSTHTDCTPASMSHLKPLHLPTTLKIKQH
jgi:hypothetical protein